MNRVTFLVDGFNLYHSIKDLAYPKKLHVKWLNIHSLCVSYLYLIGREASLSEIYYFSAFAGHLRNPGIVKRHQDYIKCLESTGIIPEMGRFKSKEIKCPLYDNFGKAKQGYENVKCPRLGKFEKHEEKETDIAIAARLFEVIIKNSCDTVVLITGDTDMAPAVKTCQRLFPNKTILFAFPYKRHNQELKEISPRSFKIHADVYGQHLFSDTVRLQDGSIIHKPLSW